MIFLAILFFAASAFCVLTAFDAFSWDKLLSGFMVLMAIATFCFGKASYGMWEYENAHPCIQTEVQQVYVPLTPQYIYTTGSNGMMTQTLVGFTGGDYENETVCVKRK